MHEAWDGRTRGGTGLFRAIIWALPKVGIPGLWLGSFVIGLGFLVAGGGTQYATFRYARRVRPELHGLSLWWFAWRRYASFGRILCDRPLVRWHPERYRFTAMGQTHLRQGLADPRGCVLLAAHVGNWELSGMLLPTQSSRPVHLVMVRDDHPEQQASADANLRDGLVRIIDPRDAVGAGIAIQAALGRGETVCFLGDRVRSGQPSVRVPFLGVPAEFPVGPFHAALVTGAPVIVAFLMKIGPTSYRFEVDAPQWLPATPRGSARTAVLAAAVAHWVQRLEAQVRRYPLQWHNFYDIWQPMASDKR